MRFPARWYCGDWPEWLGWQHIASDVGIATAYGCVALVVLAFGRRVGMHTSTVLTAAAFFTHCGAGHAIEAVIFWHPIYFIAGHNKVLQLLSVGVFFICLIKIEAGNWKTPKQARETLAEAQAIFNMSSVATYVVDDSGSLTMINRAMQELTGWSNKERGKNMHHVLHHHHEDGTEYPLQDCQMFRAMKDRKTVRSNHDVIWDRDGNAIKCAWVSTPIFVDGKAVRTQIQIFPKTEKTLSEHAAGLRGE